MPHYLEMWALQSSFLIINVECITANIWPGVKPATSNIYSNMGAQPISMHQYVHNLYDHSN